MRERLGLCPESVLAGYNPWSPGRIVKEPSHYGSFTIRYDKPILGYNPSSRLYKKGYKRKIPGKSLILKDLYPSCYTHYAILDTYEPPMNSAGLNKMTQCVKSLASLTMQPSTVQHCTIHPCTTCLSVGCRGMRGGRGRRVCAPGFAQGNFFKKLFHESTLRIKAI